MTDSEFLGELQKGLRDNSWPMKHWLELERRGFHILEDDPTLMEAINKKHEALNVRFREVAESAVGKWDRVGFEVLDPLMKRMTEASRSFPEIEFPNLLGSSVATGRRVSLSEAEDIEMFEPPAPPTVEMQVAQLEALSEIREEIRESRKRGWSYWLMVTLTAIAALAAVVSVILAIS
ncbi:MAG: hypothetical protein KTV45_09315 [Acidimicrobiia bacterium]|nr:hypothetical protein [Acidimicrobiia bacterium]